VRGCPAPDDSPVESAHVWVRLQPTALRLLREAAVVSFFLGLSVLATRPLAADLAGQQLAGPDPLHHMWSLNWTSGHLLEPSRFFHGNIFHPSPYSVLYMDLSLGTVVLAAPLRLVFHDPVPLFNAAILVALTFSGWAFCLLVRDLTGSSWAGLVAGTLATFSSHQMSHVYHMNLLSTGWMPLLWLALGRLLRTPSWRWALLAGVSFSLAAQSSGYYAVASAVVAVVFALWHWRALRSRRVLVSVTAAALTATLLTAPYIHAFMSLRGMIGMARAEETSQTMAFDPTEDLGSRAFVYRGLLGTQGQGLFPGILCLALAGLALLRKRPHSGLYLALTLTLLVLSLGPRLSIAGISVPLPYRAVFAIPPLDSMRHPYTFAAVAGFCLSVLAGLGFAALAPRARGPHAWFGLLALLLATGETLGPPVKVWPVPRGLPPVYQILEKLPPGPVLEIGHRRHILLWAARLGWPTLNGEGAFAPPYHSALKRRIRNHWIRRTPEDIDDSRPMRLLVERFPVRYLVVSAGRTPGLWPLVEALGDSRLFSLVAEAEDGDRIYERLQQAAVSGE
jgi:hypothetical protein